MKKAKCVDSCLVDTLRWVCCVCNQCILPGIVKSFCNAFSGLDCLFETTGQLPAGDQASFRQLLGLGIPGNELHLHICGYCFLCMCWWDGLCQQQGWNLGLGETGILGSAIKYKSIEPSCWGSHLADTAVPAAGLHSAQEDCWLLLITWCCSFPALLNTLCNKAESCLERWWIISPVKKEKSIQFSWLWKKLKLWSFFSTRGLYKQRWEAMPQAVLLLFVMLCQVRIWTAAFLNMYENQVGQTTVTLKE